MVEVLTIDEWRRLRAFAKDRLPDYHGFVAIAVGEDGVPLSIVDQDPVRTMVEYAIARLQGQQFRICVISIGDRYARPPNSSLLAMIERFLKKRRVA